VNIVRRELKANLKSLLIWSIGVLFMIGAGMGKYAGMGGNGETMNELMAQMPKSLQAIMGTSGFDLSAPIGYYGLLFLYLVVMAAIHAVMLGANIIAKEERDKTVEFLLVKPISRHSVITSKFIAAFINIVIFNLITLISSVVMVRMYSDGADAAGDILLLMGGMFFLQLLFLAIGASIAAMYKKPKKASALATAVLLINFIFSIIINLNENLDILAYVTPFKYFEASLILQNKGFDVVYLSLSLLLTAVLIFMAYHFYQKKDLNI
jgi:ABC-2 type transport system permease protein